MAGNPNNAAVENNELDNWREIVQEQGRRGSQRVHASVKKDSHGRGAWERLTRTPFLNHTLAQELKRHQITGTTKIEFRGGKVLTQALVRHCLLGRCRHWVVPNQWSNHRLGWPAWGVSRICFRWSNNLFCYAMPSRVGIGSTEGRSTYGLSGCVCRSCVGFCSRHRILVSQFGGKKT